MTIQTPDLTTPALLDQNKSLESLINSAGSLYETQEEKRLKIDLSNVSFLKPHVMNPKTYELAHQGHTREQAMKTETIKSLEQQRRYKRFLGTYESKKSQVQYQKVQISNSNVTASSFPKNYNILDQKAAASLTDSKYGNLTHR